ncbi:hypothetical protein A0F76_004579 [Salmonella enterica subsp. enterica serovar Worthington]|uniref:Uncharacterized protein n=2 Tax=Enterobacteriaceae TaxID=543 RepID=A0A8T6BF75_ECOLX|nr:hypothetical protein [Salmonella enterica subsp. enterica serovar Mbandaka]EDR0241118.1 hypothetical protein [Salmonella enterica subsp. enterica serovar Havana]EDR1788886.1 hypothetical protein [Salmonella enterica subsp. enterica serovar Typhi]EDR4058568.1 hypothetical protein [Salmonella enterica]EDS8949436.1 hypothetical protein [Salmonella enterica subsp. enterica serovar Worthington]EDT4908820.1 hypothetical protein [Salmonella enterica subsp. enterica]EEA5065192.1 hypothetical prote
MSLQVSHYNMLRASHEGSQKVVVRTVITVRFVPGADVKGFQGSYLIWHPR